MSQRQKVEYPVTSEQISKWQDLLIGLKRGGDDLRWDIRCPVHDEDHASATIQWAEDDCWWNCQACERVDPETNRRVGTSVKALVAWMRKHDQLATVTDISTKQDKGKVAPATEEQAERWAETLQDYLDGEDDHFLFTERGLTLDTIKYWKLGLLKNRITIPVYSLTTNEFVNCRVYNHQPREDEPKIYWRGNGATVGLIGSVDPTGSTIVVVEGEFDMLLAWQLGYSTVTTTGGSTSFKKAVAEFAKIVGGKDVILFLDNDDAGRKATRELQQILSRFLGEQTPKSISVVSHEYEKDLTDILVKHKISEDDVAEMINGAEIVWRPEAFDETLDADAPLITMDQANGRNWDGKVVRLMTRVTAVPSGEAYKTPSRFDLSCAMNKGKRCEICPLFAHGGKMKGMKIRAGDRDQLNFVGVDDEKVRRAIQAKYSLGCADLIIDRKKDINIRKVLVQEASLGVKDPDRKGGLAPGEKVAVLAGLPESIRIDNKIVEFIGKPVSDPKTQRNMFMFWTANPKQNSYENFQQTPELHRQLQAYQTASDGTPLEKFCEIAKDLETVTGIVEQDHMHQAILLTYCSAREFMFDEYLTQGTLDIMLVGDTRTGKSQSIERLINHFHAGEIPTAERMTLAGLTLGGDRINDVGWITRPGLFPRAHGMLVIIDEIAEILDNGIFGKLSSARSSGKVSATMIGGHSEMPAQTRKIWMSNPPKNTPAISVMAETGLSALAMLFKAREDLARFDMAVGILGVPTERSGKLHRKGRTTKYISDLSTKHIEWCWSRTADNISWESGTEEYLADESIKAAKLYKDDVYPLIIGAEFRVKVAKVSVAIALATYSTVDGENVIVDNEHVDAAIEFYHDLYSSEGMPYLKHSDRKIYGEDVELSDEHRLRIKMSTDEREFIRWAHAMSVFRPQDYPFDREIASQVTQMMNKDGVLRQTPDGYMAMYGFQQWCKDHLGEK